MKYLQTIVGHLNKHTAIRKVKLSLKMLEKVTDETKKKDNDQHKLTENYK